MWIVNLEANPNGSHNDHRSDNITAVPAGWAMIPDDFIVPSTFPFVGIEAEDVDGVHTVTAMTEGEVPEVDDVDIPSEEEDTAAMLIDHEYRLTLLELGISEY